MVEKEAQVHLVFLALEGVKVIPVKLVSKVAPVQMDLPDHPARKVDL